MKRNSESAQVQEQQALNGAKEVRMPTAAELIADSIRKLIINGELKPGDNLPSETVLMSQFNASHPVMREAFRILEVEQFIAISRGARKGARILVPEADMVARYAGYVLQSQGGTLRELYEARNCVGPFVVRMLAEKNAAQNAGALWVEVDRIRMLYEAGDMEAYREAATRFDYFLVELAGNEVLSLIYLIMEEIFEGYQLGFPMPPSLVGKNDIDKAIAWWFESTAAVIRFISQGDAGRAERQWRNHLRHITALWEGSSTDRSLAELLH